MELTLIPLRLIVIILLVLLVVGLLPRWPYVPPNWGYYPSGSFGLLLIIIILVLLFGVW